MIYYWKKYNDIQNVWSTLLRYVTEYFNKILLISKNNFTITLTSEIKILKTHRNKFVMQEFSTETTKILWH